MLLPVVGVTVGVNVHSCEGVNENVSELLCVQEAVPVCECVGTFE